MSKYNARKWESRNFRVYASKNTYCQNSKRVNDHKYSERRKELVKKVICPSCFHIMIAKDIQLRPGFYQCEKCNTHFIGDETDD